MPYESAPLGRRLLARALDLAMCCALAFVLAIPVTLVGLPFVPVLDRGTWGSVGAAICLLLAYVALELFLLVRRDGQTLGKGLAGLRVVPVSPTAPRLTPAAALVRLVILLAPFVLMGIAGGLRSAGGDVLGYIGVLVLAVSLVLAAVPGVRRTLHDLVAGSRVVRAPRRGIDLRKDLVMMVPGRRDLTKEV
ncbi:MAG: RDD family protein [Pseudonocardia sp.]|uniref:RDD family protein n=1 Tax=unclassified Pseudonocardia TaxID=2619320 RepID=UPI001AC28600|nr:MULTISPECIES: RDD family protein [unclassified Pseudonocardia]MBN9111838.1 RDD family protein [Pseudonocardia sp.]